MLFQSNYSPVREANTPYHCHSISCNCISICVSRAIYAGRRTSGVRSVSGLGSSWHRCDPTQYTRPAVQTRPQVYFFPLHQPAACVLCAYLLIFLHLSGPQSSLHSFPLFLFFRHVPLCMWPRMRSGSGVGGTICPIWTWPLLLRYHHGLCLEEPTKRKRKRKSRSRRARLIERQLLHVRRRLLCLMRSECGSRNAFQAPAVPPQCLVLNLGRWKVCPVTMSNSSINSSSCCCQHSSSCPPLLSPRVYSCCTPTRTCGHRTRTISFFRRNCCQMSPTLPSLINTTLLHLSNCRILHPHLPPPLHKGHKWRMSSGVTRTPFPFPAAVSITGLG